MLKGKRDKDKRKYSSTDIRTYNIYRHIYVILCKPGKTYIKSS